MAISSLASRLIKAAGPKTLATTLDASAFGDKRVICKTMVDILNVMCSGHMDGGITAGITQIVGDSRTFKTNLCVEIIYAWLQHDPEAIVIFGDCEFGGMAAFETRGCDMTRIIHVPFTNVEELTFQVVGMLGEAKIGEKVLWFVDSISQVASKKEAEDAEDQKSVTDMTRAKSINSFFRIITPQLNLKGQPFFFINSYYDDTSSPYAEPIIKGGKQNFLSSDAIWFVTRSQDKDDTTKELLGWNFNYSIMKSRFVKEKAKFTIHVTYDGGIDKRSSMFELAKKAGYIIMPTSGYYQRTPLCGVKDDKKYRLKELMADDAFWEPIIVNQGFRDFVRDEYALTSQKLGVQGDETVDPDTGEVK
jgi:RecA/RadA recombinase